MFSFVALFKEPRGFSAFCVVLPIDIKIRIRGLKLILIAKIMLSPTIY